MRSAALCLALAACGPNPAFDPATTQGPATTLPADTTTLPVDATTTRPVDPTTSSASTMAVDASSSPTADPSVPGDSSGESTSSAVDTTAADTTAGPACAPLDAACSDATPCCGKCSACIAGTCALDDSVCGACGMCNGLGECEQAKPDSPCDVPLDDCEPKIWGLENGVCYATLPFGRCDEQGACVPQCADKGAPIVTCDPLCLRQDQQCNSDSDLADVTFDKFCHHDNQSGGDCKPACTPDGTALHKNRCDDQGMCTPADAEPCAPYVCDPLAAKCTSSCLTAADCALGHTCVDSKCM